jgi:hypothetical protein
MDSIVKQVVSLAVMLLPLCGTAADAEPVKARLKDGNSRGFLVLSRPGGPVLAHGEQRLKSSGDTIENHLIFKFKDGSLYDETVTYSQRDVFRLEAYRLVQRGPSFPTTEVSFDRKSGAYDARTQEKKGDDEKTSSGPLELPNDVYNGMALVLLKNGAAGTTAQMAVFTPKPRLIRMELSAHGEDRVRAGGETWPAARYLVKLEVGGLTGVVASLLKKDPPDIRYWLISGDVPAFAGFEGAMYLNGPVWRVQQTGIERIDPK